MFSSTYNRISTILIIAMLVALLTGSLLVSGKTTSVIPSARWVSTIPVDIPNGVIGTAVAFSRGHLFVVGGSTGCGNDPLCTIYDSVFLGNIALNGSVQNWDDLNTFPSPIAFASAATTPDGWIYITGGASNISAPTGNTWYALPSVNGQINSWNPTSPAAPFTPRFGHASVVSGAYLYVLGGFVDLDNILTEVSYAQIDLGGGGLTSNWNNTSPLVPARYGHSAVSLNNRIYVIGGVVETNTFVPTKSVVFAEPSGNGAITSWQPTQNLPSPVGFGSAIAVPSTNKIYVFGGWNGGNVFTKTAYSARVNKDNGQIEEWVKEDDLNLPEELFRHSIVFAPSGSVYLIGGKHSSNDNEHRNSVYYIPPFTLSKSSNPSGSVSEGDAINYTLSYVNTSLITQTITITDVLPFNASLLANSISPAPAQPDSTLVWNLGDIPSGESGQISFQMQIPQLPPITPASTNLTASSSINAIPVVCSTNRFFAAGVTGLVQASVPFQVTIPPDGNPSMIWLLMKGINNDTPTVDGKLAELIDSSNNEIGATLWAAPITPTLEVDRKVVTITTANPDRLNALFLFDKDDEPFPPEIVDDFQDKSRTFNHTLTIPPGFSQTTSVILPVMDIVDDPNDTRRTTITVKVDDVLSALPSTHDPNVGNGLLLPKFSFLSNPISDPMALTAEVVTMIESQDSVYMLPPQICRMVSITNTAQLCSQQAGCVSTTIRNDPLESGHMYLPIILKYGN